MGVSRGVTHDYAHPDTRLTAMSWDISATLKAANSLAENLSFDPARGPGDLVSLSAGLTGRSGQCNPETAKEFGERFLPKLDDMPYTTTIKRSEMVKSLTTLKPSVGSVASLSDNTISVWPSPIVYSAHFGRKQKS